MYQQVPNFRGHEFIAFLSDVDGEKELSNTYSTSYRGYTEPLRFIHDLNNGLNNFRCSLGTLSLNYPKENRRIYLINIFQHLECVAETLREFNTTLKKDYPFVCKTGPISVMQEFPSYFSEEYHPTPIDYHNHKMHYMVYYHYEVVMETIDLLTRYAASENLTLHRGHKRNGKALADANDLEEDYLETILSSAQLSYLFFLVAEEILDQPFNKMHLAKFIAKHFKTPRRIALKPFQIYKAFYEQEERTSEVVKEIIFKIYQRLKSSKRD